ncbi:23684_t:CDS:1, partial [Racocetra persica]
YDKEIVDALLEIQNYQYQLKKILDNDMHDLRSASKPNNPVFDNFYEESIRYKRLFFCYFVISITGFIMFYLHITKEHYKELAMIQG